MSASCYCILNKALTQDVLGKYIIFELSSIVYEWVVTSDKQPCADIDNACKNSNQVRYDCEK